MKIILFIIFFIIGGMFFTASHIPVWLLGGEKPKHPYWKLYGLIGIIFWLLFTILAITIL
ncbi:hypothetical protein KAT95_02460 [Candidatus Parcubacteria bacterium]|nr:hypothetical protein [Candidatus Parcubacteria bacterium]